MGPLCRDATSMRRRYGGDDDISIRDRSAKVTKRLLQDRFSSSTSLAPRTQRTLEFAGIDVISVASLGAVNGHQPCPPMVLPRLLPEACRAVSKMGYKKRDYILLSKGEILARVANEVRLPGNFQP